MGSSSEIYYNQEDDWETKRKKDISIQTGVDFDTVSRINRIIKIIERSPKQYSHSFYLSIEEDLKYLRKFKI